MRAHQAASSASSSREKCTRPLVVGPSPVITPSRTMVRACAAVSRQEISDGSRAPIGSASPGVEADIGVLFFLLPVPAIHAGRKRVVNDSKLATFVFYAVADWLL